MVEACIALFINDDFVHPYLGDMLVVVLLYSLLMSFVKAPVPVAVLAVLLFACAVEAMQYVKIIEKLGLQHSRLARTVIGTSFSWMDILMYALGALVVYLIETTRVRSG